MKSKQFAMGEGSPQPLDIGLFKYECEEVLGMDELSDSESYTLAQFLIEHYIQVPKSQRAYLRDLKKFKGNDYFLFFFAEFHKNTSCGLGM